MKKYWLTGLVLAAGLGLAGAADAQIKFGVAGPITGPNASFGAQLTNGAGQAAEDFNKAGGILGQKVELSRATTFPIPSRAFRSPTNSSATASNSSSAISTPA